MATAVACGENVTAYCKVCGTLVGHTVVAVKGARPQRVQCKTCEDVHPYRARRPTPRKRGASGARFVAPGDASYDSLMKRRDPSTATEYAMTAQFAGGDLLRHVSFGIGVVTRVLADGKIEVLFASGTKTLAHQR